MRFELMTSSLPRKRSTPELHRRKVFISLTSKSLKEALFKRKKILPSQGKFRAGDQVRTGDIQLGRLTLYQLSYSRFYSEYFRMCNFNISNQATSSLVFLNPYRRKKNCGESRIRTCEDVVSRFTVCPRWPLEYLPSTLVF